MANTEEDFQKTSTFNTNPSTKFSFEINENGGTVVLLEFPKFGLVNIKDNKIEYVPKNDFNGKDYFIVSYDEGNNKVTHTINIKVGYSFRAKSHILSLLGDELIGSDNLAIFELVKNAYDADAEEVIIKFNSLNSPDQSIVVEDDGHGMSLDTLKNVWLEIGTDSKRGLKRAPSEEFRRISLGEKGVGRLAVHKLGKSIILETQHKNSANAYRLQLNWQNLINESDYIDETSVEISTVDKQLFKKNQGTRITIKDLKKQEWTRGELRELTRKVNTIISPFKKIKGPFRVQIDAGVYQEWIADVKDTEAILEDCVYYFDFKLKKDVRSEFAALSWNYKFNPPKSFKINSASKSKVDKTDSDLNTEGLENVFNIKSEKGDQLYNDEQKHLLNSDLEGIGEITGRFYVYNLLAVVLRSFGQSDAIKNFVRENCGVKIFRDGIRVYNYGEPDDDWLGLDLARVQRLGSHFSKNITVGSIEITQEGSFQALKEKTNREGFDENQTYLKFKNINVQIFRLFETLAQPDRDLLKDYIDGLKPTKTVTFTETIDQIYSKIKETNAEKEVAPLLRRIEKDYNNMREVMLNSGMTGINLGIVFHEVDREVKYINADLKKNSDIDLVKQRVQNLIQLLEGFSPILRQNVNVLTSASDISEKARNINNPRFEYHKVIFSSPLITKENEDFKILGPANLLISALSNIIDNAIYWVCVKKEIEKDSFKSAIYIGSDMTNFSGPAIIVADNGNGFNLEPEDLVMPYRTTRPGGMGLGLYFVNLVMEMLGGSLVFPDPTDVEVPSAYNGALLALVFPQSK